MSASCIDDITITYDSNDISFTMPQGGITVPLDLDVPFDWQWQNKTQLDLFDKVIESDWVAASSLFQLEGEDGVVEARDYYIEQKEYLKDCQDHGWLKSTYDDGSQKHHFWSQKINFWFQKIIFGLKNIIFEFKKSSLSSRALFLRSKSDF